MAPLRSARTMLAIACVVASGAVPAIAGPPSVVSATPDNGDESIDPGLKEIRITFDQAMSPGGYSFCGGGPTFPETTGKPHWDDPKTFVLPVTLKPNQSYVMSVNCPASLNFRSVKGEPAEIYPISFRTAVRGGISGPPLSRDQNKKAMSKLRRAIDDSYSYRDVRHVDWKSELKKHSLSLERARTPAEFAREAARVLKLAHDRHIWLKVGDLVIATARGTAAPNIHPGMIEKLVHDLKKPNDIVWTGRFDDGIGYIMISSWAAERQSELDAVDLSLDALASAKGLILDVRLNSGGDELLARRVAGCFVPKAAVYSRNMNLDKSAPGGFAKPFDRIVEPRKDRRRFEGRVAVLMGPENMSSCESFLLMMKQDPQCKLFGAKSCGSSGNPKPHDLGNGVTVFLPSWKDMLPDGTLLEGRGIEPDVRVRYQIDGATSDDPVLGAALKWLREN